MSKRRWLVSVGAGALLLTGAIAADSRAGATQQDATQRERDEARAAEIALAAYPDAEVREIESEREDGRLLHEVELSNGVEVEIDLTTGTIVETEQGDDGEDDENGDDGQADDADDDEAESNEGGAEGAGTGEGFLRGAASLFGFLGLGGDDAPVAPGTLDDGEELLPQARITLEQAVEAARKAGTGAVGEVDLEDYRGRLVFNVDIGTEDVKVDATTGEVLGAVDDEDDEDDD